MYQESTIGGFEMQPLQLAVMIATTKVIDTMKESLYSYTVHTVPLALCKNEIIYHCSILKQTKSFLSCFQLL